MICDIADAALRWLVLLGNTVLGLYMYNWLVRHRRLEVVDRNVQFFLLHVCVLSLALVTELGMELHKLAGAGCYAALILPLVRPIQTNIN